MNGHQIVEARKRMRLSQTEFAEKLGVSRGAIHLWETDRGEPTRKHRKALAELIGVEVDPPMQSSPSHSAEHVFGGGIVPVFRTITNTNGGPPWSFRVTGEVVDMVNAPLQLRHRKDLRAFQVPDDHLAPRYFNGEMIWMSMARMAVEGDFVVIMRNSHNGGGNDNEEATLGRLVKSAANFVEIEQYKPAKHYKIARKEISEIWRIIPAAEFG